MPLLSVTTTKTQRDEFGVTCKAFKSDSDSETEIFIDSVLESGIFGGTDLKAGQQVISINGTEPSDIAMFKALLASAPDGDVTMIVRTQRPPSQSQSSTTSTFNCQSRRTVARDGYGRLLEVRHTVHANMRHSIDNMPGILRFAGVPRDVWILIYTLIKKDLMPVSLACFRAKEEYSTELRNFWKKSKTGMNQFDKELKRVEQATNMKGFQVGILHNNVTLVATAVKDRANSMLTKYNITAAIAIKEYAFAEHLGEMKMSSGASLMLAVGLDFYQMDFQTATAFAVPASVVTADDNILTMPTSAAPLPSAPYMST